MAQAQALQSLGPFFEKFAQMVVQSRRLGPNDVIGTDTHVRPSAAPPIAPESILPR